MSSPALKSPLMVALDVDRDTEAEKLADALGDVAGCLKLGPRLIHRYGESLVRKLAAQAPVFVDCKFFDIPSTMEAAVRATFEAGATFTTVHAMAGPTALRRLAAVEAELNRERPFKILAVTILTSWGDQDFSAIFRSAPVVDQVRTLASEVRAAGLTGLVCSPHELDVLQGEGHYLVTPGVRLPDAAADDQTRIMTPAEAVRRGASAFVVGRPIIQAANPREAALNYAVEAL